MEEEERGMITIISTLRGEAEAARALEDDLELRVRSFFNAPSPPCRVFFVRVIFVVGEGG